MAMGRRLTQWGVSRQKIVELDWWESIKIKEQLKITATPAQHFSGRRPFGRNLSLWASWTIQTPDSAFFFSGDTGYFEGFKEIGETFGPFDMTFLECGAYDKRWSPVHMFPEQTVQAHIDLKGKILHPIHWGTFSLSFHPWYEPMHRLRKAAHLADIDFITPIVGETVTNGKKNLSSQWWSEAMKNERQSNTRTVLIDNLKNLIDST